jgi:histidyl-tRNA synthetase
MIKTVKGTRDLLPPESFFWGRVEEIARALFSAYGFEEIRTPILEETQLFVRGIGEGTDIVHKEMFTFPDRKGRSMTMRPEMTASVVRAYVEHGFQQRPRPLRLWYMGPMFRYERPQKGRYRQFHQIGAELFGAPGPEADAEVIAAIFAFLRRLRFDGLVVRVNSVGDAACRPAYVEAIRAAAEGAKGSLCPDCLRRVETNPLRVLDCKVPGCREAAASFPRPSAFLCDPCRKHAERLAELLAGLDIPADSDDRLVRGLDYYTRTVFEVAAPGLGSQDAIVGGGRYDRLVSDLGGPETPAVGFAAGLDRIIEILPEEFRDEQRDLLGGRAVVVPIGDGTALYAFQAAETLRVEGTDAVLELLGRGPKAVLARAAKEGFRWAVLVGEKERDSRTVVLKDLDAQTQKELPIDDLAEAIQAVEAERFADELIVEHPELVDELRERIAGGEEGEDDEDEEEGDEGGFDPSGGEDRWN